MSITLSIMKRKHIIFIWITDILIERDHKFRQGASRFIRLLSQHVRYNCPETMIVLVTAKPIKKIIPEVKKLLHRTGVFLNKHLKILCREDIVFAERERANQHNFTTPDAWRMIINAKYEKSYSRDDMIIIDCPLPGEYQSRHIADGYADRTILLQPSQVSDHHSKCHVRNLEELQTLLKSYIEMPVHDVRLLLDFDCGDGDGGDARSSVLSTASAVFCDSSRTVRVPATLFDFAKKSYSIFFLVGKSSFSWDSRRSR